MEIATANAYENLYYITLDFEPLENHIYFSVIDW